MADIESLLNRWQSAGALDAEAAARIRAYEAGQQRPAGLRWQVLVALILGAILLACGVVLFVNAHWDDLSPGWRYALVITMLAVFHIGGGFAREKFRWLSTTLHAVGTVSAGAAIALVGQIFNIQEHWPAAVLLWAVAALAGWSLLRDQAQQTLALLLVPAWMLSELEFHMTGHIGGEVYTGRFLFVWALLYLTFFVGSKRRAVQGILFGAGAIAAVTAIVFLLMGWRSWWYTQTFIPFGVRVWAWIGIAAAPLMIAAFKGHKGLIPIAVAIGFAEALPWCLHIRIWYYTYGNGSRASYSTSEPNLAAHALVAGFAVFLIWWGVRLASKALVNFGIVGFAASVGWFYFSNIFDKMGRSLGLIGLGILFLAGGWALEVARRRLLRRMGQTEAVEVVS
ncbi:MAG TPA: DUF2157 domain-containing protein [Terracidiphilus sp.]|nr:DUF2157 domain-containing protein [Terracidiphilus sp.]